MALVTKYLWILHSISLGVFLILINCSSESPTPQNTEEPPANTSSVPAVQSIAINDGQTMTDKMRVLRALAGIERRMEELHSLPQPPWSTMDMSYLYEMDIVLTPSQAEEIYEHGKLRQKRKMSTNPTYYWKLPIYYGFDGSHSHHEMENIRDAIRYWESLTCIRFKESSDLVTESDGNKNNLTILFTRTEGCWSYVGRRRNAQKVQKVAAADGCLDRGSLAHELGHVIGFWHEHSRPDRKDHVHINWDNIKSGSTRNFLRKSWDDVTNMGIPYDVGSVMHYSAMAYAYGNSPTIIAKEYLLQRALGQRHGLSFYDVKLANLAYCSSNCESSLLQKQCLNGGYQDPLNCGVCRCPEGLSGDYCERVQPSVGVSCSEEINVTENVTVIDRTESFIKGQKCNWFLKAQEGMNVHFDFVEDFMTYKQCYGNPYYACLNFVEVRYSLDLANTGARFCCSQRLGSGHLISQGNEMTVLLRAYTEGSRGFKAHVWAEPCGGCADANNKTEHTPCYKRMEYACKKSWKEKTWSRCKSWFTWRTQGNCNKWIMIEKFRMGKCYQKQPKCCAGFILNGTKCIADTKLTPTIPTLANITENVESTHTADVTKRDTSSQSEWTSWSNYSECSQTCGGCGVRTRHRTCSNPSMCGGKSNETESDVCEPQPPCETKVITTCQKPKEVKHYNIITGTIETRTVMEDVPCNKLECCEGYTEVAGICTKKKS